MNVATLFLALATKPGAAYMLQSPMVASPPNRGTVNLLAKQPAPPEVIEAEAKAMPNRPVRLGVATGAIGLSGLSGILSFAVLIKQPDAMQFQDLVLFDNPVLSLVLDVVIGGACAWSIQQELETKEKNTQRIWEEVQRRRSGGAASGENRSQRRAKKMAAPPPPMFTGGGGFAPSPPSPPLASSPAPTAPSASSAPAPASADGGFFAGAKNFFEEANEMGKAGAIQVRRALPCLLPICSPHPRSS